MFFWSKFKIKGLCKKVNPNAFYWWSIFENCLPSRSLTQIEMFGDFRFITIMSPPRVLKSKVHEEMALGSTYILEPLQVEIHFWKDSTIFKNCGKKIETRPNPDSFIHSWFIGQKPWCWRATCAGEAACFCNESSKMLYPGHPTKFHQDPSIRSWGIFIFKV